MSETEVVLKVGAGSDPRKVGSSVAHCVFENKRVTLRAVGAGAVNQAVKATAISSQWTAPRGIRVAFIPGFEDIPDREGTGTISAMTFKVVTL